MNLNIGPLAFQWAHILALACALLAISVGRLVGRNRRVGISEVVFDMALVAVPTGRDVFVALWFAAYQVGPWSIFDIRDDGFDLWSASVAAALMAAWRIRQRPALKRPLAAGLSTGFAAWCALLFVGFSGGPPTHGVPALCLPGSALIDGAHSRGKQPQQPLAPHA
ncbi:MAG: hypothetical protein ACR2I0_08250 [Rhodoferax sp.]